MTETSSTMAPVSDAIRHSVTHCADSMNLRGNVVVTERIDYDKLFVTNSKYLYVASGVREVLQREESQVSAIKLPASYVIFGRNFEPAATDEKIGNRLGENVITRWQDFFPAVHSLLLDQQGGGPGILDCGSVMKLYTRDAVIKLRWHTEHGKWFVTKAPRCSQGLPGEEKLGKLVLRITKMK